MPSIRLIPHTINQNIITFGVAAVEFYPCAPLAVFLMSATPILIIVMRVSTATLDLIALAVYTPPVYLAFVVGVCF